MPDVGTLLVYSFYGAMLAALAYFVHKVFWFIQFRRLQDRLVARALDRLRETTNTSLIRWDRGAESSWSEAIGSVGDESPVAYVRRIEFDLSQLSEGLAKSRALVETDFAAALANAEQGRELPAHLSVVPLVEAEAADETDNETDNETEIETETETETDDSGPLCVLRMPRLFGPPDQVALELDFPRVHPPKSPDTDLYRLEVRSRYGIVRRGLAFLLGAADVVYSSQHMAKMSQNVEVPTTVILRRLSLVALILGAIVIDIVFGIRPWLAESTASWMEAHLRMETFPAFIAQYLPGAVSLSIWLACYGSIYVGLYVFLRRRSLHHVRRLGQMRDESGREVARILERHLDALRAWGSDYARTLDEASAITVRQAEMLIGRTVHRLRRRLASPQLLDLAERVAAAFFANLPESSLALRDVATEHRHSFWHGLWPRPKEMRYQVEQAKQRAVWRHIEMTTNKLRGQRPDPAMAEDLWRNLVSYSRMFPEIVPTDVSEHLNESHLETIRALTRETEADLHDLDTRLGQLAASLEQTFAAAAPLVESRVDLVNESIQYEVASLAAEVLKVRERARLEAMAFEI